MTNMKTRRSPRISCAKLGEYMVSSPTRRRRIISDQKWPSDFIAPRYTEAQEVVAGFIRRGGNDISLIECAIDRLLKASAKSKWHEQKNELCIDALKSFMNVAPDLDLRGYALRQTGNRQAKMKMGGVEISVRPELLVRIERKGKPSSAGAIKLYFSKNNRLSADAANYVGTMLHEFACEFVPPLETAAPGDCILIDVFAERIYLAPRATKRRRSELIDGCAEIATMWDSIAEPKERTIYRTRGTKSVGASVGVVRKN